MKTCSRLCFLLLLPVLSAAVPLAARAAVPAVGDARAEEDHRTFADGLFSRGLYRQAAEEYQRLVEDFPGSDAYDLACFRLGESRRLSDSPVEALKAYNRADGTASDGYDDIFVMAAVPALLSQCSSLLAYDGCLNFFAGPKDKELAAPFNFYNVHYMMHHVAANSGSLVGDMVDCVDWIGKGILHPEVMVTHVGGLDSAADATLNLLAVPGGKRLVYTHVSMPMTAIADFAEKGKTNPLFAALDRICAAHNGLWGEEAEDYLLAHAPKIEIGEPKERIVERNLSCS